MSYNITEVDKGFYRSPRPTKQLLACWQLAYGIGAVLTLEGDAPGAVDCEKGICAQLKIDESFIAMSGVQRPSANALREAVDFILANQKAKIPVLAHCRWGINRTGIVCAAYRVIVQGWSVDVAWSEALSIGSFTDKLRWIPLLWWRRSLIELKGGA